jgi:glycosyltransferase involved in cell wall biosynthesis
MQGAQTESRFRGIGRYSLSLAQAIARNPQGHEIWLALNAKMPESIEPIFKAFEGLIPKERIRIFHVPTLNGVESWRNRSAEIIRESFIQSLVPDVLLLTSMFEGHWANAVTSVGAYTHAHKTAVILYDLIPLIHADKYLTDADLRIYYDRKLEWMKSAELLLAISESSRQEGIAHLAVGADKVVNISTAIDAQFKPPMLSAQATQQLLTKLGIHRQMVLYAPGGFDQRKNFANLTAAYSQLSRDVRAEHQLVIVSKLSAMQRDELNRLAQSHGLQADELILTGYVVDEDLIGLYSLAKLFVFPSLHEGFGLPALEAMACGAPVIGSNTTSVPEVIGLSEALFDPESIDSMTHTIDRGLTDAAFRQRLLDHGRMHVQKFSWDTSAQKALWGMEQMHQQRHQPEPTPDLLDALAKLSVHCKANENDIRAAARSMAFNEGTARRQCLLDISTLVHTDARSGIQRVVRSLISELFKQSNDHLDIQPIYFEDGVYRYAHEFCEKKFAHITGKGDGIVDFFQDDIYLSLDLNMHLSDLMHPHHQVLRSKGIKIAFVVYDILLAKNPQWWTGNNAQLFKTWLHHIGEVATNLVCISQAVAQEVEDWFKNHPPERQDGGPKVHHFHLGADVDSSVPSMGVPEIARQVISAMNQRQSFLMVSTIEPRKGYAQALAAFEILWTQGHDINLVIVGKRGWLVDELIDKLLRHPQARDKLIWLEGISDEYLQLIYQNANCLIAASEGEGFGLPLIEAAQHALPLIARDMPVFREVAKDHAHYFSGQSPSDLSNAIQEWRALHAHGKHPTTQGMKWLTWKESADQLVEIMELN